MLLKQDAKTGMLVRIEKLWDDADKRLKIGMIGVLQEIGRRPQQNANDERCYHVTFPGVTRVDNDRWARALLFTFAKDELEAAPALKVAKPKEQGKEQGKKPRRAQFLVTVDLPDGVSKAEFLDGIMSDVKAFETDLTGGPAKVKVRSLTKADLLLKQGVFAKAADLVLKGRPENSKKELIKATIRAFISTVNVLQASGT